MQTPTQNDVFQALDDFAIELPSWGFANTGTRFGKFPQPAAAVTIDEKLHDAGLVHRLTGSCPTVAVHVLWDFDPSRDPAEVARQARDQGIRIGSINPTLFQDACYKFGSLCSPMPKARQAAMAHVDWCIQVGCATQAASLSLWLADGTNYPGQDSLYGRKARLQSCLKQIHEKMQARWPAGTLLLEYKPFEPAFYHTDIADWGMAYVFARHAGPQAKVLVDTGHHLPGANIEHIVAFLLDENMLGGFHFNDRKYADDDLTLGSIDPYAVFRIFDQIWQYRHITGQQTAMSTPIAYMIDQSHNLKPKLQAMVQTVVEAQRLYLKAMHVDRQALSQAQAAMDIVAAEQCLKRAYDRDVDPLLTQWRQARDLPVDPMQALRESGIEAKLAADRSRRHGQAVQTQSYA